MTIYDLITTKLERQQVKYREVETSHVCKTSIAEYVSMIIRICLVFVSMDYIILQINIWGLIHVASLPI